MSKSFVQEPPQRAADAPDRVRSRAKKRTTLPRTFLGLTHMGGSSTSAKPCTALGSWRSSQPASPSFSPQLEPRPQGGHGTPSQAERFSKAGGRKHAEHSPRSPRNLRGFQSKARSRVLALSPFSEGREADGIGGIWYQPPSHSPLPSAALHRQLNQCDLQISF